MIDRRGVVRMASWWVFSLPALVGLHMLAQPSLAEEDWRVTVAPYAWAVSLDGDAAAGGEPVSVDSDFRDVFAESDSLLGAMLHVEVGKGRWSVLGDVAYARVGVDDIPTESGEVDAASSLLWAELTAAYRAIEGATPDGSTAVAVDALAGVRLTSIGLDLDIPGPANDFDDQETWVEPIVGGRMRLDVDERWTFTLRGDVGGFGAGSDFAWQAVGTLGYRFHLGSLPTAVHVGYRALGQDYESGGFAWDAVSHGPLVGLAVSF